jgi:hypothetical protein
MLAGIQIADSPGAEARLFLSAKGERIPRRVGACQVFGEGGACAEREPGGPAV